MNSEIEQGLVTTFDTEPPGTCFWTG